MNAQLMNPAQSVEMLTSRAQRLSDEARAMQQWWDYLSGDEGHMTAAQHKAAGNAIDALKSAAFACQQVAVGFMEAP